MRAGSPSWRIGPIPSWQGSRDYSSKAMPRPKPPKLRRGKDRRLRVYSQLRDPIGLDRIARAIAMQVIEQARIDT